MSRCSGFGAGQALDTVCASGQKCRILRVRVRGSFAASEFKERQVVRESATHWWKRSHALNRGGSSYT